MLRRARPTRRSRLALASLIALALQLSVAAGASAGRVLLVGVDGASWNVLDPMLAAGELPNLAAIARDGVSADLETVEPVISPVVWTSIATGRSPDHHGVTDFFRTALSIRVPTVFERLAARGLRVGLYDYLVTWPPADLPGGFVIPGWLRRDASVSPPDVWSRIALPPWVNAYAPLRTSEEYRLNAMEETQGKAARWIALSDAFDVQVGAVSFYGVDAMSHRFWNGAYPEQFTPEIAALATDAQRTALRDVLRGVDRSIGELRAHARPDDTLIVVSDHGFRALSDPRTIWVSHIGDALSAAGLDPARDGFAILTGFGQLVVRIHPADADGLARADETARRIAELIESIRSPDGDGLYWSAEVLDMAPRPPGRERSLGSRLRQWLVRTVLERIFGVELQTNAHALIVALPRSGVLETLAPDAPVHVGADTLPFESLFTRQLFTGDHAPVGVLLAAGGPISHRSERARVSVLDVAPLIFYLAGAPLPDDLEGRLPSEWIAPERMAASPVATVPAAQMPGIERPAAADGASGTDPELIENLRRLGYIE